MQFLTIVVFVSVYSQTIADVLYQYCSIRNKLDEHQKTYERSVGYAQVNTNQKLNNQSLLIKELVKQMTTVRRDTEDLMTNMRSHNEVLKTAIRNETEDLRTTIRNDTRELMTTIRHGNKAFTNQMNNMKVTFIVPSMYIVDAFILNLDTMNQKLAKQSSVIEDIMATMMKQLTGIRNDINGSINDERESTHSLKEENERLREELASLGNLSRQLNISIEEERESKQDMKTELQRQTVELRSLLNATQNLNKSITDERASKQNMAREIQKLVGRNERLENETTRMNESISDERASKQNMADEIQRLVEENKRLESSNKNFTSRIQEFARAKNTTQSSTSGHPIGLSSKAVDGNFNSHYENSGTCSHTHLEKNPWWSVDLGQSIKVTFVTITNRGNCCGRRLREVKVYVSSDSGNPNIAQEINLCAYRRPQAGQGETIMLLCEPQLIGRHVIIQLAIKEILTMCEVQVFGYNNF